MSILNIFRYRLSTLLVLTTAVAVSCGILYGLRDDAVRGAAILVASLVYPAVLISVLVYGESRARAFAMGALLPLALVDVVLAIAIGMRLFEAFQFARELPLDVHELAVIVGGRSKSYFAVSWLASLPCGFVCYATRSLLLTKWQREAARRDTPESRSDSPINGIKDSLLRTDIERGDQ